MASATQGGPEAESTTVPSTSTPRATPSGFGVVEMLQRNVNGALEKIPNSTSSNNVSRFKIPLLADIVFVDGAEEIQAFETSPDVGRLSTDGSDSQAPGWFFTFMKFSKFYCPQTSRWFIGMCPASLPKRELRMQYIRSRLAEYPPTDQDVDDMARLLLRSDAPQKAEDDYELAEIAFRIVAQAFLPQMDFESIPKKVKRGAVDTILEIVASPMRYFQAAKAQNAVYKFVEQSGMIPEEHVEDVTHNFGAACQGVTTALYTVKRETLEEIKSKGPHDISLEDANEIVRRAMFGDPTIAAVPRVAIGNGTVNGLLKEPLEAGKTFILLNVGKGASLTQDDKFLFGPGTEARQCPFKHIYFGLASRVVQKMVAQGRPLA